jgi:MFS-type transporter involved in bile tolerance (Atg22 family)
LSETARALLSPLFLIFLVGKMAFTTGLSGIATWSPSFFHRAYGLSNTDASSIFASGWVSVGLIGVLLGGWIGGVWRRRNPFAYPLVATMGCAITAPALFAAFLGQNQAASHVFILLEIFFTCFCLGPVNALLIETVPVAQRSAASAVTVICANGLSNVISADLIGAISDKANLRVGMLVAPIAFVLSGLLFLVYTLVNHRRASQEVRSFRVGRGSVRAGVAASSPARAELRPTVNLHRMEAVESPSTDRKAAVSHSATPELLQFLTS